MAVLENAVGFLLLAAAAYFAAFLPFGPIFRGTAVLMLAGLCLLLWVKRAPARVLGIACVAFACFWLFRPEGSEAAGWRKYSHASFEAVLGSRPVLVDFTADWCPTCKVVEATALKEANLRRWEREYGITLFRVDMTRENPEGEALLRAVGSASIPVIAVFGRGEGAFSPFVLRDVVTGAQVAGALEAAATRR